METYFDNVEFLAGLENNGIILAKKNDFIVGNTIIIVGGIIVVISLLYVAYQYKTQHDVLLAENKLLKYENLERITLKKISDKSNSLNVIY